MNTTGARTGRAQRESIMEQNPQMQRTQGLMVYLGSLANGLEVLLGRGSDSICFRSGRTAGLHRKVEAREPDVLKAVEVVAEQMRQMGINWPIRPFKRASEAEYITEDGGVRTLKLAVENCIVRCTLFRYGFPQKQSLCNSKHGIFCGLFDQVNGNRSKMEIIHAGENGCLLRLVMYK